MFDSISRTSRKRLRPVDTFTSFGEEEVVKKVPSSSSSLLQKKHASMHPTEVSSLKTISVALPLLILVVSILSGAPLVTDGSAVLGLQQQQAAQASGSSYSTSPSSAPISDADGSSTKVSKRGTYIGNSFRPQDLHRTYKEIKQEYFDRAFDSKFSKQWKTLTQKDYAKVELLEHPSDPNCPYVKMTATIPTSLHHCWEFLSLHNWSQTMPKMDPFYESVSLHGQFSYQGVDMILARKKTKRILTFGRRDFVFLSVSDTPLRDGTWVSGTVSVETPQIPRQHGYTRAFQDSIAFYKPFHDERDGTESTHVTIICRIDLNDSSSDGSGGWMPMWLYVKTIGATGVQSVTSMRQAVLELAAAAASEQAQKQQATKEKLKLKPPKWMLSMKKKQQDDEKRTKEELPHKRNRFYFAFWKKTPGYHIMK